MKVYNPTVSSKGQHDPENYPSRVDDGLLFVRYPVWTELGWYAARVVKGGYTGRYPQDILFKSEQECQSACDQMNTFNGFTAEYAQAIVTWSMFGKFTQPKNVKQPKNEIKA